MRINFHMYYTESKASAGELKLCGPKVHMIVVHIVIVYHPINNNMIKNNSECELVAVFEFLLASRVR